ncbi:MAG: ion channel [Gammaproteobacteria bacterium]
MSLAIMSQYKYEMLLAAQILLSVISPLFSGTVAASIIVDIAITAVFATAIYVISSTRKHFMIGLVLMLPSVVLLWSAELLGLQLLELIALTGTAMFLCYIAWLILSDILHARLVTFDIIAGGISVYLLFGNVCGVIYAIIARLDPGAFNIPEATAGFIAENISDVGSAMYFSFVTLTTLGYGDITPINAFARALAYLEAATGQIYLTVLIASLVGMHITRRSNKRGHGNE